MTQQPKPLGVKLMFIGITITGFSVLLSLFVGFYLCLHSMQTFSTSTNTNNEVQVNIPIVSSSAVLTLWLGVAIGFVYGFCMMFTTFEYKDRLVGSHKLEYHEIMSHYFGFPHGTFWFNIVFVALSAFALRTVAAVFEKTLFFNAELLLVPILASLWITQSTKRDNQSYVDAGWLQEGDNPVDTIVERRTSIADVLQRRFSLGGKYSQDDRAVVASVKHQGNSLLRVFFRWWVFASCLSVLIFYPFTVVTIFLSSDILGRMAVVLLVHPIVMESVLISLRASSGNGSKGKAPEPIRDYSANFTMESFLILTRRIMLCNLGSFQATTIAIIITGIEETITRVTIEQRDLFYRKHILGKAKPTPTELKFLKKNWACAVFHGMMAETASIIISTLMYILYR